MADDSVKIIDFGVAHTVSPCRGRRGSTKAPCCIWHPAGACTPVSPQSDIYSLGVTLYEALTRRQPFRGATEDAVIQAILTLIPPPASDLNPAVSQVISRVVAQGDGQGRGTGSIPRESSDTLQKAARNEAIAIFDPSRTQPRIQTATKALDRGDYQFAGEIVGELEAEGNIDPQIALLRTQIDQISSSGRSRSFSTARRLASRRTRILLALSKSKLQRCSISIPRMSSR